MKKQAESAVIRKDVHFVDGSLKDLQSFPKSVRQDIGFQIDLIAMGDDPSNFSPIPRVGPGAMELRVWDEQGTFRVLYVAKFDDGVHVLHCFNKKRLISPIKISNWLKRDTSPLADK